jgi:hypothetical protein
MGSGWCMVELTGNGFGERNMEGEMTLECAEANELAVLNTWFKKIIIRE